VTRVVSQFANDARSVANGLGSLDPESPRGEQVAAFIITRIQTGDYDKWRPMFDQDKPRAREKAHAQRVLRSVDDPNEVFIYLEFPRLEDASEAAARLLSSGVLDRFEDKHGPNVLVDAG
jgi:hypothetical protein